MVFAFEGSTAEYDEWWGEVVFNVAVLLAIGAILALVGAMVFLLYVLARFIYFTNPTVNLSNIATKGFERLIRLVLFVVDRIRMRIG